MENFNETSVGSAFQNRASKYNDKALMIWKQEEIWKNISWNEVNEMVRALGLFLIHRGVQPGDKIVIFSPNRYEWWVADLAILSIGAVTVPIYATSTIEEVYNVIENSEPIMCFAANNDNLEKILKLKSKFTNLEMVVTFDKISTSYDSVISFRNARKEGIATVNKDEFDKRLSLIGFEDLATISYSSGTTGKPKGVMLTHKNLISNLNQVLDINAEMFSMKHTFLSYLPLSNTLERILGYYMPMFLGQEVAFAEDLSKLIENLQEVRPSIIVSAPMFFEKVHSGIMAKVAGAPPVKKALFNWSMGIAKQNIPFICNGKPRSGFFAFKYDIANNLIFSKLTTALGMDKFQVVLSGGGPLSAPDAEFFLGMGIKVLEVYSLTEATSIVSSNKLEMIKPGSVGNALKDTILKIGEENEIQVKGPQVMKGYYKNMAATKDAFTEDGFLRTGDMGEIDDDGCLKITGRIKGRVTSSPEQSSHATDMIHPDKQVKETERMLANDFLDGEDTREPNDFENLRKISTKFAKENPNESLELCLDQINKTPDYYIPYLWASNFQNSKGNVDASISTLTMGLRSCKRKSDILTKLGERYLEEKKNPVLATISFGKAILAKKTPLPQHSDDHDAFLYFSYICLFCDYQGAGEVFLAIARRIYGHPVDLTNEFKLEIKKLILSNLQYIEPIVKQLLPLLDNKGLLGLSSSRIEIDHLFK